MIVTVLFFVIFIYSIILHEIAHGWIANRLGDPTAKIQGRLTLNPIPHIDPLTSILMPLLMLSTGFPVVFGAAKPVPIDAYNLRHPRKDMGLIGLAGPATNLLIAIIFSLFARIVAGYSPTIPSMYLLPLFSKVVMVNIFLAVFNLIPIPPLDGGRVLAAILPERYAQSLSSVERYGFFIVLFFLLFPNPLFSLSGILYHIAQLLYGLIFFQFPLI